MRLTINGQEVHFDRAAGVEIVLEVDEAGETMGPVLVEVRGGPLAIDGGPVRHAVEISTRDVRVPEYGAAITLRGGRTIIDHGVPKTMLEADETQMVDMGR